MAPDPTDGAAVVRIGPRTDFDHARDQATARRLLAQAGMSFIDSQLFVGTLTDLDGVDDPADGTILWDEYLPQTVDTLSQLVRDANLDVSRITQTTVEWDGVGELAVTFDVDGAASRRFDLTRLGPGQVALAWRLASAGTYRPAEAVSREVDDVIAGIVARTQPAVPESDEAALDPDPDDPLGFLVFADVLTRAGVLDWPAARRTILESLANDWSASPEELIAVVSDLDNA